MLPTIRAFPSSFLLRRAFSSTPSAHLARITLVGRLAADPEATITSTGKELIKYAVGSSSGPQDNRKTSWFRVSSFDEGARRDYLLGLKKGTMVYVDGDARLEKYQAEDGKTHQALNITQRGLTVLARPRESEVIEEARSQ